MASVSLVMDLARSFAEGVADVVCGIPPLIRLTRENEKLRVPLFRCVLLNGIILLVSVVLFEWVVIPVIEACVVVLFDLFSNAGDEGGVASQVGYLLWYLFAGLWVLPLFWISKPLNAFWFQDIANEAFKRKVSQQEEKSLKSKLEKSTQSSAVYVVADILFSLVMDMLFMLQSAVVGFIPVIGYPLSLVHQVLLISLYAFEYRCYSEGLANCKYRIHIVEGNLVYFLGFGAPLAAVMLYPSSYIVSTCCFALLFPVTIVSAYEARHIDFLSSAPRSTFKFPVFNLSAKLANEVTTFLLRCLLGLRTSSTKKTVTLKTN